MSKQDLRVIKTKRAIFTAFNELIAEKSLDKITVTELSLRAEINKATFYLHYRDIYDLYQDALNEHLKNIADQITFIDLFFTDILTFSKKLVINSVQHSLFQDDPFFSKENAPFYQSSMQIFCNALTDKVIAHEQFEDTDENRMKLHFIFSGIGSLLRYDPDKDTDTIIEILVSTCKCQFPQIQ